MVIAANKLFEQGGVDRFDPSVSSQDTVRTSGVQSTVSSGSQLTEGTWAERDAYLSSYAQHDRQFAFMHSAGIGSWLDSYSCVGPDPIRNPVRVFELADGYLVGRAAEVTQEFEPIPFISAAWMDEEDPATTPLDIAAFSVAADVDWDFSPFDVLDRRAEESVHDEIGLVADLDRSDAAAIYDRLTALLAISVDESEIRVLSPGSVRAYREFLSAYPNIKTPSLFLTDSGSLRAQWTYAKNQGLAVLFQPDGIAQYVVFAPDQRRPSITNDHAGRTSWQSLLPSLGQNSELDWLFDL